MNNFKTANQQFLIKMNEITINQKTFRIILHMSHLSSKTRHSAAHLIIHFILLFHSVSSFFLHQNGRVDEIQIKLVNI